ncbi:nuclear transport factor 2 family protein [Roseateles chitinivorans]|uniref:nuclear transport factor 2 family protein n=1 Tax=Roseateles chitinivorans TaxID=2917965 RepID=UPI003D677DBD
MPLVVAIVPLLSPPALLAETPPAPSVRADIKTAERNRARVVDAFDAWAQGGNRFFDDLLSPSVRWTIRGSGPTAGTYVGLEDFVTRAVRPFASRLSTPVRPVAVHHVFAQGDDVAVHWDGEAQARDGRPYRNSYVWIFRMKDGRVTEATAFLDLAPYEDVIRRVPLPE